MYGSDFLGLIPWGVGPFVFSGLGGETDSIQLRNADWILVAAEVTEDAEVAETTGYYQIKRGRRDRLDSRQRHSGMTALGGHRGFKSRGFEDDGDGEGEDEVEGDGENDIEDEGEGEDDFGDWHE